MAIRENGGDIQFYFFDSHRPLAEDGIAASPIQPIRQRLPVRLRDPVFEDLDIWICGNAGEVQNQRMLAHHTLEHKLDAVMTVDAMENIPPEDWPLVLSNLHRAVRPGGHLYLTVEENDESQIQAAFEALVERGFPAVPGEVAEGDVAGYHYYPVRDRVIEWFDASGLEIVSEYFKQEDGWGYRHFLLRDTAV